MSCDQSNSSQALEKRRLIKLILDSVERSSLTSGDRKEIPSLRSGLHREMLSKEYPFPPLNSLNFSNFHKTYAFRRLLHWRWSHVEKMKSNWKNTDKMKKKNIEENTSHSGWVSMRNESMNVDENHTEGNWRKRLLIWGRQGSENQGTNASVQRVRQMMEVVKTTSRNW